LSLHRVIRPTDTAHRSRSGRSSLRGLLTASLALLLAASCAGVGRRSDGRLDQTAALIREVKSFGRTLGIEPTEALSRTASEGPPLSMLWLWMQREGTLALDRPLDIRTAIGYRAEKEQVRVEQIYRVDGYSVYCRQGSEFADPRSLATAGFAEESLARRVKVILHEDLHGDANFALAWEIEEAVVTPLGALAAVEWFRRKGDSRNLRAALTSLDAERRISRDLIAVVERAKAIFARAPAAAAKQEILTLLADHGAYHERFARQVENQHAATALEAKLSHDLAYYRYFDAIAVLAEAAPDLTTLIADLKTIPADADHAAIGVFLRRLAVRYGAVLP
jgi:hypothetical protein